MAKLNRVRLSDIRGFIRPIIFLLVSKISLSKKTIGCTTSLRPFITPCVSVVLILPFAVITCTLGLSVKYILWILCPRESVKASISSPSRVLLTTQVLSDYYNQWDRVLFAESILELDKKMYNEFYIQY